MQNLGVCKTEAIACSTVCTCSGGNISPKHDDDRKDNIPFLLVP